MMKKCMQIIGFLHTDSVFKPYPKGSCNPNHTVPGTSSREDEYTAVLTSETTSYFFSNTHGRQLSNENCHFEPPKWIPLENKKVIGNLWKDPENCQTNTKKKHITFMLGFHFCVYIFDFQYGWVVAYSLLPLPSQLLPGWRKPRSSADQPSCEGLPTLWDLYIAPGRVNVKTIKNLNITYSLKNDAWKIIFSFWNASLFCGHSFIFPGYLYHQLVSCNFLPCNIPNIPTEVLVLSVLWMKPLDVEMLHPLLEPEI